ncbi:hypothetical protein [Hymenobacter sp. GOD-10R]|uniref:hypothetical protein n=1 Tax=Hymenobacter sp. GOD-10R TaxID=3093922 RepID=UPI002D774B08|nr:hypothetical protein [Hymenobacter sp. GOD-10R]WRQ31579.1 hypothetical protein SD425_28190 [Hymenobacter sp. GOD-10R]
MAYNRKFGPAAQTPQQRAHILHQLLILAAEAHGKPSPHDQHLYQRYVAGELSWVEILAFQEARKGWSGLRASPARTSLPAGKYVVDHATSRCRSRCSPALLPSADA